MKAKWMREALFGILKLEKKLMKVIVGRNLYVLSSCFQFLYVI